MKISPYSAMVEMMKKQGSFENPPTIQLGKILSPPPNLKVKINDLIIDNENIMIADSLLKEHTREYKSSSDGSSWGNTNYFKYMDTLKSGDIVAALPTESKQTYIILARVVSL